MPVFRLGHVEFHVTSVRQLIKEWTNTCSTLRGQHFLIHIRHSQGSRSLWNFNCFICNSFLPIKFLNFVKSSSAAGAHLPHPELPPMDMGCLLLFRVSLNS